MRVLRFRKTAGPAILRPAAIGRCGSAIPFGARLKTLKDRLLIQFSPFASPEGIATSAFDGVISLGSRRVPDFAAVRAHAAAARRKDEIPPDSVFVNVRTRLSQEIAEGRRAVVAAFTAGSRERLGQLLADAKVIGLSTVENWDEVTALPPEEIALTILPIERGFSGENLFLVTEQDILGERIVRTEKKRRRAEDFIAEVSEIAKGDLVVHVDHGIGRYDGLETLDVAGAPHDCLRLFYAGDDRLYVPVENVEVLSRYGSGDMPATLDRLGGAAWQARKSRMNNGCGILPIN